MYTVHVSRHAVMQDATVVTPLGYVRSYSLARCTPVGGAVRVFSRTPLSFSLTQGTVVRRALT